MLVSEYCKMADLQPPDHHRFAEQEPVLIINDSEAALLGYGMEHELDDDFVYLVHDFGATKLTISALIIKDDFPVIVYSRTWFDISGQAIDDAMAGSFKSGKPIDLDGEYEQPSETLDQVHLLERLRRSAPRAAQQVGNPVLRYHFRQQFQEMKHHLYEEHEKAVVHNVDVPCTSSDCRF